MKRFLAILLLVIGLVSLAAGIAVPLYVNANSYVKQADSVAYKALGQHITPALARELLTSGIHTKMALVGSIDLTLDSFLKHGITILGQTYTLSTFLKKDVTPFQTEVIRCGIYVYAYNTQFIILGGVLTVLGLLLLILGRKRRRR